MTRDELQAIKALADAATPGEWVQGEFTGLTVRHDGANICTLGAVTDEHAFYDAAFIAAARAAVPALVAEVERLQTELAAARIAALAYRVLSEVCRECEGTGEVDSGAPKPEGGDYYTVTCPSCNGTGKPFFGADLSPERQARLQRYIDGGAR